MNDGDRDARAREARNAALLGDETRVVVVVTHREGEEVIWRSALVMNPTMTQTQIDDFITTPTDMGSAHRPDDLPPLSDDEW